MSRRIASFPLLAGAQADASHPKRQVWLSASAGTGKTQVLTARVLRLLLSGADPDTILCLTFTKAGAAEMSSRIQERLASWVRMREQDLRKELTALGEPNDDAAVRGARRLFARVLDAPGGGLRIQTLHAFSQALLTAFPAEAGLAPGFRPLDGRAEAALVRSTLGRLLVEAERGGDLGLIRDVQALSRRLGEGPAEAHLMACARAPHAFAGLGPREGIEARVKGALGLWLGDVEARLVEECGGFDCAGLRRMAAALRAWGTKTGIEAAETISEFLNGDGATRVAMLDRVIALVLTKDGSPRKISEKLLGCDPQHGDDCDALAEAIGALLKQRTGAELAALLSAGLRAGQAFARAYAEAKRAAGAVDFDDLIRLTLDLIERDGIGEWIRYKLDRRTDHVLIDEGQDTNVAQWRIVRALADEFFTEAPGEGRVRTIFSVGDFKQAIFGFQGTNPQAFGAARAYFGRAAEESGRHLHHLSLDRSFRSAPPILELVDRVVDEVGQQALGLIDAPEPHVSAKAHLPGTVTLWRPLSAETAEGDDEGEEDWLDDAQRLFASRLAEQVRLWLAEPLWVAGKKRPLRPEDVLILVRKRGDLASLIVARLHAEGVPVAGVDRLRLSAPLAVRDLMAAIRFALQPEDDLTLANLLVSPLVGLDQDGLYRIAFNRQGSLWAAFQANGSADAVAHLRALLSAADFGTPYRFLEAILSGPLDGRRKLLRRLGGEALDPIEELLNAALLFEGEATPTLQRFLDWFDRGEVEVTRDPSAPLDAVRVMTVHGAKGLQAPLVILADATGNPDTAPARGLSWPIDEDSDPVPILRPRKSEMMGPLADLASAAEAREREEHWRLLYVAATRAEERLVIGGALGPRAKGVPPPSSWYAALDRALEGLGGEMADDPLWGGARHFRGIDPIEERRLAGPAKATVAAPAPQLPSWLREKAPVEARPPRPLAPSAPEEDLAAMPPPGPAMRAAARRGKLLHALFERLPGVSPADRQGAARAWLMRSGEVESEGEADGIVADACRIIDDPAYRDLFGPDALAEAPIAATLANGIVVAGTVDRLLVTPDTVTVIDFKTGRRTPGSVEQVSANHLRQMAAYAAALGVIFPTRRIDAALLYTAGPSLIRLPGVLLDQHKPGLGDAQQNHALNG